MTKETEEEVAVGSGDWRSGGEFNQNVQNKEGTSPRRPQGLRSAVLYVVTTEQINK